MCCEVFPELRLSMTFYMLNRDQLRCPTTMSSGDQLRLHTVLIILTPVHRRLDRCVEAFKSVFYSRVAFQITARLLLVFHVPPLLCLQPTRQSPLIPEAVAGPSQSTSSILPTYPLSSTPASSSTGSGGGKMKRERTSTRPSSKRPEDQVGSPFSLSVTPLLSGEKGLVSRQMINK